MPSFTSRPVEDALNLPKGTEDLSDGILLGRAIMLGIKKARDTSCLVALLVHPPNVMFSSQSSSAGICHSYNWLSFAKHLEVEIRRVDTSEARVADFAVPLQEESRIWRKYLRMLKVAGCAVG